MKKCLLTLIPSGKAQSFLRGMLLADALLEMGVRLRTPCGGRGTCGKCQVQIAGIINHSSPDSEPVSADGGCPACRTYLHGNANVHIDEESNQIDYRFPNLPLDEIFCLAVDIGTTSVKVALVKKSGETYLLDNFLNPQRRYGDDIISRIAAADNKSVHEYLTSSIRKSITVSINYALEKMHLPKERIDCIAFSGNTTMLYLFLGLDVVSLGRAPYFAPIRDFDNLPSDLGFSPLTQVKILPVHSAFLGADLIGSLAVCDSLKYKEKTFFIDLGTNGEIFLINPQGEIFATSCAMGPALEGMNITCGMTADDGAITHVRDENCDLMYDILGQGRPAGICGTALIDLLSIFLKRGIVEPGGVIKSVSLPYPALYAERAGQKHIDLWENITVTQKDIRQVQLAKGASLAAALRLLAVSGCAKEDIKQVIIAGALGEYLDLVNFRRLGFIPEFPQATFSYLGNTSLMAAARGCINDDFIGTVRQLRDSVNEVTLVQDTGFQELYLDCLSFPEEMK
jgi:uncharacterized 2Fe-2S/4Fe-4S cluster protein (DUF4445 family)